LPSDDISDYLIRRSMKPFFGKDEVTLGKLISDEINSSGTDHGPLGKSFVPPHVAAQDCESDYNSSDPPSAAAVKCGVSTQNALKNLPGKAPSESVRKMVRRAPTQDQLNKCWSTHALHKEPLGNFVTLKIRKDRRIIKCTCHKFRKDRTCLCSKLFHLISSKDYIPGLHCLKQQPTSKKDNWMQRKNKFHAEIARHHLEDKIVSMTPNLQTIMQGIPRHPLLSNPWYVKRDTSGRPLQQA
jgi:hypothetical protein